MGVMSCSRYCCQNIMCDTYVDGIGYICDDCQNEFKHFLVDKNQIPNTESEIRKLLKEFLETEKIKKYPDQQISIDDFFKQNTFDW